MVKVVFVCLGNICRSPTAEGVFRALVKSEGLDGEVSCDSAGTGAWHVGQAPDKRMTVTARKRGVDLSDLRARQAVSADFERFDYVIAMDQENKANLSKICPPGMENKLFRFLEFAPQTGRREVPDPYYGGPAGFDLVVDLIEEASKGLLADIREKHL